MSPRLMATDGRGFDRADWAERFGLAIASHDLACAAHRLALIGGGESRTGDWIEAARLAVVALLDEGIANGLTDDEMDVEAAAARARFAEIAQSRVDELSWSTAR